MKRMLAVLSFMVLGASGAHAQDAPLPPGTEALLQEGRARGMQWLQAKDRASRDAAKSALERAEKMLKEAAKRDAGCQGCVEGLAGAQFLQAYFGISKNYKECLETAGKGLQRFPTSARLAYYKGFAHHGAGEWADATRFLQRYTMASTGASPEADSQARALLQDSQEKFLGGWHNQRDFYNSPESKITTPNLQTQQLDVLFQVTPDYELSLGQQAFTQLSGSAPRIADAELEGYLQGLVNRLVEKTPGSSFTYKVTVVDSPEINAVTPPGHILVYKGLLAFAENEAELAAVLSHELAHNYGHHAARQVIKGYHAQMVASAITNAFKPKGEVAQALTQLGGALGVGLFMKAYSRFEEKEADMYGSHILFNAGYSPTAMSGFFAKLYREHPKQPIKFLSTHPPLPDRVDYLTDYLEAFPLDRETRADSEEFQRIKQRVAPSAPKAVMPVLP